MTASSVCCLCLTADRQRFTDRAVKSFLSQTYAGAWLLIYDTGQEPYVLPPAVDSSRIVLCYCRPATKRNIGALRNEAIDMASRADVIAHWDSDDWSAPERLAAQIRALENGSLVAGFHNLLFLDARRPKCFGPEHAQAWEYDYKLLSSIPSSPKVVGTSLLYRREAWERLPFNEHKQSGEDTEWTKAQEVVQLNGVTRLDAPGPLMIAEVHGDNTSGVYKVFDQHNRAHNPEWRRAPEWDAWCRERMYP